MIVAVLLDDCRSHCVMDLIHLATAGMLTRRLWHELLQKNKTSSACTSVKQEERDEAHFSSFVVFMCAKERGSGERGSDKSLRWAVLSVVIHDENKHISIYE